MHWTTKQEVIRRRRFAGGTLWVAVTCAAVFIASAGGSASQLAETLGVEVKTQIIERVVQALRSTYVTPDVGERMAASLMKKAAQRDYDSILDPQVFADTLTSDLRSVYRDLHLSLQYESAQRAAGMANNTGPSVERVQVLDGNIGYFQLNGFVLADAGVAAAMKTITSTDALIIDLRTNTGGAAPTFLTGYFFEKPTLIARVTSRPQNTTSEMWTEDVPGPLYLNKPVYVLTSRRTFSVRRSPITYSTSNVPSSSAKPRVVVAIASWV
jgi:hypothetical protein